MCGSGLVDAVAQLVEAGLIDHSGKFIADEAAAEAWPGLSKRLVKVGEERVFVLAWRGEDPANSVYPVAARRARAAVCEGVDRNRLEHPRETISE